MSGPGAGRRPADPAGAAARAVRAAALAVPGVTRLSAGPLGEVATYLPGERVPGVRLATDGVHVHVVLSQEAAGSIPAVAAAVQGAVAAVVPGGPVHVHVDDVDPAGRPPRGPGTPPGGDGRGAR